MQGQMHWTEVAKQWETKYLEEFERPFIGFPCLWMAVEQIRVNTLVQLTKLSLDAWPGLAAVSCADLPEAF